MLLGFAEIKTRYGLPYQIDKALHEYEGQPNRGNSLTVHRREMIQKRLGPRDSRTDEDSGRLAKILR